MNPKPGYLTTEFWQTTLLHVISIVTVLSSAQGWAFNVDKFAGIIPVAALIASGVAQFAYSHSRGVVKAAEPSVVPATAPAAIANGVPPFQP